MRCFGTYKGKLKKGLGLILFMTVAACTVFGSVREVKAASASVKEDTVKAYNEWMRNHSITNSIVEYNDSRLINRARALMEFSNDKGKVLSANGKNLQFYSDTDKAIFKDWKRGVT